MGKKRGNVQAALQQQITRMQIKAMEPHITQVMEDMAQQIQQKLAQQQLSYVADANVRIHLLEQIVCDKLGYTRDQLSEMILDNEDDVLNLRKLDREVQKGDHCRVNIAIKGMEPAEGEKESSYGKESLYIVKDVMTEGCKHILNIPALSEGLLGLKTGESREIELIENKAIAKVTIQRVCEKILEEVKDVG